MWCLGPDFGLMWMVDFMLGRLLVVRGPDFQVMWMV